MVQITAEKTFPSHLIKKHQQFKDNVFLMFMKMKG